MRFSYLILLSAMLACFGARAEEIPSYVGKLIGNPPQPPAQCERIADNAWFDGDKEVYYYLLKCNGKKRNSKYLRLWRLKWDESLRGSIPSDLGVPISPFRVTNEVIISKSVNEKYHLSIYSCLIKDESGGVAVAILPYDEFDDEVMIKNALGVWRILDDVLEPLSPNQLEICRIDRG